MTQSPRSGEAGGGGALEGPRVTMYRIGGVRSKSSLFWGEALRLRWDYLRNHVILMFGTILEDYGNELLQEE